MTEQEIKEAANAYIQRFLGNGSKIIGRNAFAAGADASRPKWIPTTEQMPPERVPVIVFIPDQGGYIGSAIWEKVEGWYENYENVLIGSEVTHWMPLPSPPNTQL